MRFALQLEVCIRACNERDLSALEWFGAFSEHRSLIREAFERQQRGEVTMLIATCADFPVGQIWLDFAKHAPDGPVTLWALRVLPPLRGQGLGRKLIEAGEAEALRRGRRVAEITACTTNDRARALYERLGYVLAGEVVEGYSYTRPSGERVHIESRLHRLHKQLES